MERCPTPSYSKQAGFWRPGCHRELFTFSLKKIPWGTNSQHPQGSILHIPQAQLLWLAKAKELNHFYTRGERAELPISGADLSHQIENNTSTEKLLLSLFSAHPLAPLSRQNIEFLRNSCASTRAFKGTNLSLIWRSHQGQIHHSILNEGSVFYPCIFSNIFFFQKTPPRSHVDSHPSSTWKRLQESWRGKSMDRTRGNHFKTGEI